MRFQLKQIAIAGLLATLGASAFATNYNFVMPWRSGMGPAPFSVVLNAYDLPQGVVGLGYNAGAGFDLKSILTVTGDSAYDSALVGISLTSGSLPAGMSLSAAGLLSGIPTAAGSSTAIQVTATYKSFTGVQTYQVISLNLTVTLAAATLPVATQDTAYNTTGYDFKTKLSVTGDASYTASQAKFTLTSGSTLPAGLNLSEAGVLSGTPTGTTPGASFTVQAAYKLKTGQQAYTIVVNGVTLQVLSITAGFYHTCAVTTTGGAKCWGVNASGELGDGTQVSKLVPTTVFGLSAGVASLSASEQHTCAVTTAGAALCWGNNNGTLGTGNMVGKLIPTAVSGLSSGVTSISMGQYHTCAIVSGGAMCWGSDYSGMLGDGTQVDRAVPVAVSGLESGVASITAGIYHTCAVTSAGAAKCWGANNNGQLGDSTVTTRLTPTQVSGLTSGVRSMHTGQNHTCALTSDGAVRCWGLNTNGQLGDGTVVTKLVPTAVTGLATGVASLSMGTLHTCAVTTGGAAKCWGNNNSGQLGDGTLVQKEIPTTVAGFSSGVASIAGGQNHTCIVTTSGGAKCWGRNTSGQLGNGTLMDSFAPVAVLPQ